MALYKLNQHSSESETKGTQVIVPSSNIFLTAGIELPSESFG